MSDDQQWDVLPGRDAPYTEQLTYWMNRLGLSNGALARLASVDRAYPGHIKSGRRTPHIDTANNIRNHLVEFAEQPGPNGRPRLTEPERRCMDDLLRTSFDRANEERNRKKHSMGDAVEVVVVYPSTDAPLREEA